VTFTTVAVLFFSVLFPVKTWFSPTSPLEITVRPESGPVSLVLTDFSGKVFDAKDPVEIEKETTVDLRGSYPSLEMPGTYLLFAVPKGKDLKEFSGTPLVVGVRSDPRRGGGPAATAMVVKIEPLRYAVMSTDKGDMTMAFYYDVAPNTADNFLRLAEGGYYDGLAFHRIVPEFVIQGGDPKGDSSGGPGYQIGAEFSDREHDVGVLSMAREGDPLERQGGMPRPEFADSAGSQFFICLTREKTKQLDRKYTVFGKVTSGLDVVTAIGATLTEGPNGDTPTVVHKINRVQVLPVTAGSNPYATLLRVTEEKSE